MEKTKILLMGVPGAMTSAYDANFAARPNGPILKDQLAVPAFVKEWVDHKLRFMFNPRVKATNLGMHMIADNLNRDLVSGSVEVIDYPDEDAVLQIVKETWLDVVGISIGAEPLIMRAKEFASKLKEASKNKNLKVVFGNYGAASGKAAGVLTEKDGDVLWDNSRERSAKAKNGAPFYIGEGVRDMRQYLAETGVPLKVKPDDPIHSSLVPDNAPQDKSAMRQYFEELFGVHGTPRRGALVAVAAGCPNRCYFCNTTKMFGGQKLQFLKDAGEIFDEMSKFQDEHECSDDYMPGVSVTIMDENFTKPMDNLVNLCRLIQKSGRDIRFTIFGDIAGLHEYLKEHGDFKELVRGGLSAVWLGIESKRDFFKKRGGAAPEDVAKVVKGLQDLGVVVIGSFIVGLPIHTEGESTDKLENIHEAFDWSRSLKTAGYQVVTEIFTHIVDSAKAEPVDAHSQEEWGHGRTNQKTQHPHIPIHRLGELDREFREKAFLENGPMSVRAVLTLWDGFKALKDSRNNNDLRMAEYYYWTVKHYTEVVSVATAFSTLPVFKEHSDPFLQRLAVFFKEVDELPPPEGPHAIQHKRVFAHREGKALPIVKYVGKELRKRLVDKYLKG